MKSSIKKYWLEFLLNMLLWSGVTYMLSSISMLSIYQLTNIDGKVMAMDVFTSFFPLCLITIGFLMLLFYGNVFWLFKKKISYKSIGLIFIWFVLTYLGNYIVVGLFWPHPNIPQNSPSLIEADRKLNDWQHRQLLIQSTFMFIFGISVAYYFVKAWIKSEIIKKQLEANQLSTELSFLKAQINPHFLFNTLNNLFSMAQGKGNEELANGISRLAGMMRYMIYESNAEKVALSQEISYLEDTILLNKLRYADEEVNVAFNYPEQTDGLTIAPMIFIPFVENAFKHGVLIGQQSSINISIVIENEQLMFTCQNNNFSFVKKMEDANSGIGLQNIQRRLQLIYGDKYNLVIKDDKVQFVVTLKIDLR